MNDLDLPDLAKSHLFKISFYNTHTGFYEDALEVRAKRMTDEHTIYFDEYQDFYVSKFFDSIGGAFNCDVVVSFFDSSLDKIVYTKYYKNVWLYLEPISELNQFSAGKIIRVANMYPFKLEDKDADSSESQE